MYKYYCSDQARVDFQKLLKFPAIVPTEVTITITITIIQINEIVKIYQNKKLQLHYFRTS